VPELIGRGRHADVFAIDDGKRVLRRYRQPGRNTIRQAEAMRLARQAGYPVPEVFAAEGPDLVMARVRGPSLLADMVRRPWRIREHASLLMELHDRLHEIDAPIDFPTPVGAGTALLHLDLQPENVVLSEAGPVVLDWEWAARGPAGADSAHTLLQLDTSEVPGSRTRRIAASVGRRLFTSRFVDVAGGRKALDEHVVAVARYRLAERELTVGERRRIRHVLQAAGDVPTGRPTTGA
jgi:aminoglycoside phosphotransferase (APT) family kinase protein